MQGIRWFLLRWVCERANTWYKILQFAQIVVEFIRSRCKSFLSLSRRQQKLYCSSKSGGMTEQAQSDVSAGVGVAPPGITNCSAVSKENRLVWVDLEVRYTDHVTCYGKRDHLG